MKYFFEITRTIYLNSERSKTVFETEYLSNLLWKVSTNPIHIGIIKVPIITNDWDVETYRNKFENAYPPSRQLFVGQNVEMV